MKFRKKPVVIEAITFAELVEYGRTHGANIVNGMPWSFQYAGHPITHENDQCYLIPTLEGTMKFGPTDMLITGVNGEIYPCKDSIFQATYTESSTCKKCGQEKGAAEFYADKKRPNGCHTYCIECAKAMAKEKYIERGGAEYSREQARRWREANPRANKSLKLKHAFGIDIDEYERLLTEQAGGCAICGTQAPDGYLCVDHDHADGRVRGLLCDGCNKGVGFFRDDPQRLVAAAKYIKPDIFAATYEPVE